jgi:hypothetical protein
MTFNWCELIADVESGRWTPGRATIAEAMMLQASGRSHYQRLRLMRIFARRLLRSGGLWWVVALNAKHDELEDHDRNTAFASWTEFIEADAAGLPETLATV